MTDGGTIPEADEMIQVTEQTPAETGDESTTGESAGGLLTRRRIVHGLGLLVLLALVVPFVVYAVPGLVGAETSFVVLSGSMEPSISAGDVVVVAATDPSTIVAGDVITFARSQSEVAVTHRVVDVDTSGGEPLFYTKGDANDNVDVSPVPASAVIGTVVLTIPFIGYVIQFAGTTLGFVLLVVVPIGLLLVTEAVSHLRARREDATGSPPADSPSADATGPPTVVAAGESPSEQAAVISVGSNDVLLSLGILVVAVPYVVYVAIQQQTPLSIAVAVGFGTTLLLVGGVFVFARIASDDRPGGDAPTESIPDDTQLDPVDPAANGGTAPEVSE